MAGKAAGTLRGVCAGGPVRSGSWTDREVRWALGERGIRFGVAAEYNSDWPQSSGCLAQDAVGFRKISPREVPMAGERAEE